MTTPEVTVGEVPLAPATPAVRHEGRSTQRVSTRARARIAATLRDGKIGRTWVTVWRDARRSYLAAGRPVSPRAWVRVNRRVLTRVPDNSGVLRGFARTDQWTTGLLLIAVSTGLLLAAGGVSWVACHSVRRWAFLLTVALFVAWVVWG